MGLLVTYDNAELKLFKVAILSLPFNLSEVLKNTLLANLVVDTLNECVADPERLLKLIFHC